MEWDLNALLYAIGAAGLFSARAFLPAFFTALLIRFGDSLPFLREIDFLQSTGAEPIWFTHLGTIFILGLLAIAEVFASKSPEIEEMLSSATKWIKSGVAALTLLGVLQSGDEAFVEDLLTVSQAGVGDSLLSLALGIAVWFLATLRNGIFNLVTMADSDGSLGIRKLLSWFEDLWAGVGMIFLFLYPIGMTLLIVLVMLGMALISKWKAWREEKSKIPCPACKKSIYPSALHCPFCDKEQETPRAIGFFGQSIQRLVTDRAVAARRLAARKRCPHCATRLPERSTHQNCPSCQRPPFGDPEFAAAYHREVAGRIPRVIAITALFSLIPVLGLIPGIIYYRIALVSPFLGYIPAGRSLLLKILLRIALLVLIGLQIIPGIGAVAVPVMALLSYSLHASTFRAALP